MGSLRNCSTDCRSWQAASRRHSMARARRCRPTSLLAVRRGGFNRCRRMAGPTQPGKLVFCGLLHRRLHGAGFDDSTEGLCEAALAQTGRMNQNHAMIRAIGISAAWLIGWPVVAVSLGCAAARPPSAEVREMMAQLSPDVPADMRRQIAEELIASPSYGPISQD